MSPMFISYIVHGTGMSTEGGLARHRPRHRKRQLFTHSLESSYQSEQRPVILYLDRRISGTNRSDDWPEVSLLFLVKNLELRTGGSELFPSLWMKAQRVKPLDEHPKTSKL